MVIRTARLELWAADAQGAAWQASDRRKWLEWLDAQAPDSWPPIEMAERRMWFAHQLSRRPDWAGWFHWFLVLPTADGPRRVVGEAGFHGPPDAEGTVELGYEIAVAHRRQGLALESASALLDWAWAQPGVRRVTALCQPDNLPSLRILRRLSFVASSDFTEHGHQVFYLTRRV